MSVNLGTVAVTLSSRVGAFEANMRRGSMAITKVGVVAAQTGARLKAMGRSAAMRFTAPIALGAIAAVKAYSSFDHAMVKSTSIMKDLSSQQEKALRNQAKTMSTNSTFAARELADSYYFLSSAGLSVEQSMKAMGPMIDFATAGSFNLAKATDLLTDAQKALGLSSADSVKNQSNMISLSDKLVVAAQTANASVEEFAESLTNKAASAIKSNNLSLKSGIAVLMQYADQGKKGKVAGEMFNIMLNNMQSSALKNKDSFEKYNISLYDSKGNMKDFSSIIRQFEKSFEGLSTKAKVAALSQLGFGDKARSSIQSLIGSSKGLKKYEKILSDVGGATKKVADRQLKSFSNQLKMLKNKIVVLFIEIGEKLAPAITYLSQKISRAVDWFRGLSSSSQKFIGIALGILAAIGPVLIALGILAASISVVVSAIGVVVGGVVSFISAAIAFAPAILGMVSVLGVAAMAFVQASGKGETFKEKLKEVMSRGYKAIWDFATMSIMKLASWSGKIADIAIEVYGYIAWAFNSIVSYTRPIVESMIEWWNGLGLSIGEVAQGIWIEFKYAFVTVVALAAETFRSLYGFVASLARNFAEFFSWFKRNWWNLLKGMSDLFPKMIDNMMSNARTALTNGLKYWAEYFTGIEQKYQSTVGVLDGVMKGVEPLELTKWDRKDFGDYQKALEKINKEKEKEYLGVFSPPEPGKAEKYMTGLATKGIDFAEAAPDKIKGFFSSEIKSFLSSKNKKNSNAAEKASAVAAREKSARDWAVAEKAAAVKAAPKKTAKVKDQTLDASFAKALSKGSVEAYSKEAQRKMGGDDKDKVQKEQLREAKKTNKILAKSAKKENRNDVVGVGV